MSGKVALSSMHAALDTASREILERTQLARLRRQLEYIYSHSQFYRQRFEEVGFSFSGTSPDNKLVEVIELKGHPFYMACQFHPEFQSKPNASHPLFRGFIAACHQFMHQKPL